MPNDFLRNDYVPVIKGGMSLADIGRRPEPPTAAAPEVAPAEEQSAVAALLEQMRK
jgi:hypothetical protein